MQLWQGIKLWTLVSKGCGSCLDKTNISILNGCIIPPNLMCHSPIPWLFVAPGWLWSIFALKVCFYLLKIVEDKSQTRVKAIRKQRGDETQAEGQLEALVPFQHGLIKTVYLLFLCIKVLFFKCQCQDIEEFPGVIMQEGFEMGEHFFIFRVVIGMQSSQTLPNLHQIHRFVSQNSSEITNDLYF